MSDIFVYAPNCDDFDNLGECGPLTCSSALFVEEANGTSELTIEHPIDQMGRWSFLKDGYILQAEVPVRTTPEIKNGAIVTTVQIWRIKTTASKGERGLYTKRSGGKRKSTLSVWDDKAHTIRKELCVVDIYDDRCKVKLRKGYGWVNTSAIEYFLTPEDLEAKAEAIELLVPAWSVRTQLFRIYSPDVRDDGVTAKARHISYDLLGNITTHDPERTHPDWKSTTNYVIGDVCNVNGVVFYCTEDNLNKKPPNTNYWSINETCGHALAAIMKNCGKPHDFVARTNVADERVVSDWIDVSPIDALLNPESGLLSVWGVDLVRDDEELTVLDDAGLNRGVRIEYRKNLQGIKCKTDTSDLITSIKPIGQTKKGKPLYLAPGTYTVDGQTVVVDASLAVDSPTMLADPTNPSYAVPHIYSMDLGTAAKASGTDSGDILAARNKMVKACLDKFKNEKCDIPLIDLTVEFIALANTEEGKQYAQLENVYLFDRVTVWHPELGIDILTSVKRIEFDPILERFTTIEVGPVRRDATRKKTPGWKLPAVTNVAYGAVGAGALADGAVNDDAVGTISGEHLTDIHASSVTIGQFTGEQIGQGVISPDKMNSPQHILF